ncbi:MAG: ABC transporter permease subunit [Eubacteriales bacterium]|nr:ABC transporter permease subunit [Lachnospiraceae bacterium]MDO5127519.1 ABC transporter permease subunit [Eubacteriales bacterium]
MNTIYKYEMRNYMKSLLIWTIAVGGLCGVCILLFSSMEESMANIAESYASMGAFSEAFGMDKLSMATLKGFYATEVGTIHGLGGAMFAAVISMVSISKEEDGHTGEFLFTLPITRGKVLSAKLCAIVTNLFVFNLVCIGIYGVSFIILGKGIAVGEFFLFHLMQFLMQLEIAGICFGLSACMKKNKLGIGLGVVLFLYAYDLMARVIPDLKNIIAIGPFSYANAADIFSSGTIDVLALFIGLVLMLGGYVSAYIVYIRRDLAS